MNTLQAAFTQQFRNDPKLANEVVTGACVWPPEETDLECLYYDAVDLTKDAVEVGELFGMTPLQQMRIDRVTAARDAICHFLNEEITERQAADYAEDYGIRSRPSYYR